MGAAEKLPPEAKPESGKKTFSERWAEAGKTTEALGLGGGSMLKIAAFGFAGLAGVVAWIEFQHEIMFVIAGIFALAGAVLGFKMVFKKGSVVHFIGCIAITMGCIQVERHVLGLEGTNVTRWNFIEMEKYYKPRNLLAGQVGSYLDCQSRETCLETWREFCSERGWSDEQCLKKGKGFLDLRHKLSKEGRQITDW